MTVGFSTARTGDRVVASMIGAVAVAAVFGAGTASAAVTGTVSFKAEGTSIGAGIDVKSSVSGSTITCKLDVKSQAAVTTTKTAYKSVQQPGGALAQSLTVDNLQPGKYDATVNCSDNAQDVGSLTKTAVLTVTGTTPASTDTPGTGTTPTGVSGILAILEQLLSSVFGSGS